MINETRKILQDESLKITATCVRVPIENSHSESINVEFENDFTLDDILNELKNFKGITLIDDIKKISTQCQDIFLEKMKYLLDELDLMSLATKQ